MEMKRYLGDSVYAEFDGYAIVLTTDNGEGASNTIVLEPNTYESLARYVEQMNETLKADIRFNPLAPRRRPIRSHRMTEPSTEYQTEPPVGSMDIAEYQTTAAALALLREKYGNPFDVTTSQGLTAPRRPAPRCAATAGRAGKTRAELKAPVLAQGQRIGRRGQRITAELLAIEEPIDAAIQAEENAQGRGESGPRAAPRRPASRPSTSGSTRSASGVDRGAPGRRRAPAALDDARAFEPDPDEYAERWPDAMQAIGEVRLALKPRWRSGRNGRRARPRQRPACWRSGELARQQAELDRQRAAENAQRQSRARGTGPLARRRGRPICRPNGKNKPRLQAEEAARCRPKRRRNRPA